MQTLTIDIMNDKVMDLIRDLEDLQLVKVHRHTRSLHLVDETLVRYPKNISKSSEQEIDAKLQEIHNGWE